MQFSTPLPTTTLIVGDTSHEVLLPVGAKVGDMYWLRTSGVCTMSTRRLSNAMRIRIADIKVGAVIASEMP